MHTYGKTIPQSNSRVHGSEPALTKDWSNTVGSFKGLSGRYHCKEKIKSN